jgi:hypothetical protein
MVQRALVWWLGIHGFVALPGGLVGWTAPRRVTNGDIYANQIVSTSEPIGDFATNLAGVVDVEGPLSWNEGGYLLFRGTDLTLSYFPFTLK